MLADLEPAVRLDLEVVRIDAPEPIPHAGWTVFARREQS